MAKKLRVLILGGGPSSEHEISLKTAEMVARHLDKKRYAPTVVNISRAGKWAMPIEKLKKKTDLAFIAMHGEYGEDGQVQKFLEEHNIAYTGSNPLASALGMDKLKSRALFGAHGLDVPETVFFRAREYKHSPSKIFGVIAKKFSFPVVIKPNDRGSSVGASVAGGAGELKTAFEKAIAVSKNILCEEFISGTELTCGILDDGKNNLTPLLPTEIIPKAGVFFDYKSKYTESGADEITPARVSKKILKQLQDISLKTHILVGCSGFSRTDMIWDKNRNKIYVLEINTIPGLTSQSLLPKSAEACGIAFSEILDRIIISALDKIV